MLSIIIPGLGQIYNGQTRKGLLFLFLIILIPLFIVVTPMLHIPKPFNILIPLLLFFIAPLEAVNGTLNSPKLYPFRFDIRFLMMLLRHILFFIVFTKFGLRLLVGNHRMDDNGMLPAFFKNDFILIEKFSSLKILNYSISENDPRPGELLYFRHPLNGEQHDIKRCLALPGQQVEVRNGEVLIDGKAEGLIKRNPELTTLPDISSPFEAFQVEDGAGKSYSMLQLSDMVVPADNYGPVRIPKKGDLITFPFRNEDEWAVYVKLIQFENHTFSRKPGSKEVLIDGQIVENYTVTSDYYFVLGDNRDLDEDSRHWGFLSRESVIGRPSTIYFSKHADAESHYWPKIRWGRIGKVVN